MVRLVQNLGSKQIILCSVEGILVGNSGAARHFKITKYLTHNIGSLTVFNTVGVLMYKASQV